MIIEALYAAGMFVATLVFGYLAARSIYRCAVFGLMREHRAVILKHSYLLDEKHSLTDAEVRVIAVAIRRLYDYDFKSKVAKEVLRGISGKKDNEGPKMRDEVRRVARAFAALVLVENPFNAMTILRRTIKTDRDNKTGSNGTMPLARAETIVASQIPVVTEHRHRRELATC